MIIIFTVDSYFRLIAVDITSYVVWQFGEHMFLFYHYHVI